MTDETVDLYVIARMDAACAVADLFQCELYYSAEDGTAAGRTIEGWWESVATEPPAPVTLDALDAALTTSGYRRTTGWRKRVTAAGAVRFFADASIQIEDLIR
ncbi:hypothetical protein [Nocardia goodfellowii]|uniref:Uncharacterized protein n=1 Tax=Nocardia goodfellowii TaxID=882446 RepID=A0ABS4QS40_9NOCA|nr:hypothetical protein [Nocardia goodfellowii]MBP2194541.1 hypothetical protein [Nocardia goodfellowii]